VPVGGTGRAPRPERPEGPERAGGTGRGEETGRVEGTGRAGETGRVEGTGRAPRPERAEGTGGLARVGRGRRRDPGVDASILGATMELLGEVGYARLTMEKVAARARVGKASLYLRWPSKVALVADAIARVRPDLVPEVPDTGGLVGDMTIFLTELVRPRDAGARALSAVAGEAASNPEMREAFRRGVSPMLADRVRMIVQRAVDRGELPAGTDAELLALLPQALLQQYRLTYDERPGAELAARIVAAFFTPGTPGAASAPGKTTGDGRGRP
jgi:AcrR family transcriptional regulator